MCLCACNSERLGKGYLEEDTERNHCDARMEGGWITDSLDMGFVL